LEFNVPFQHKYGYIRDERELIKTRGLSQRWASPRCRYHSIDELYSEAQPQKLSRPFW